VISPPSLKTDRADLGQGALEGPGQVDASTVQLITASVGVAGTLAAAVLTKCWRVELKATAEPHMRVYQTSLMN
jgi:hypothetical protein